ncbi:hypothetical protein AVEN_165278-1 [Araneus ventricosus]|uniref:Uncharacterized protein n=1 Tax=Araneus ventricosus TaxID=182803 RepID=A0A4Y2AV26_ARAVE|nr:hypothetical protein AVEN_165278-1 [Araneus ventricosus]
MNLVILNLGQMTRTTPELAPLVQTSAPHQREDVCLPTYDLTCNRPNTRRIFSGIGFRIWNPAASRPTPYHETIAASLNLSEYYQMSDRNLLFKVT